MDINMAILTSDISIPTAKLPNECIQILSTILMSFYWLDSYSNLTLLNIFYKQNVLFNNFPIQK